MSLTLTPLVVPYLADDTALLTGTILETFLATMSAMQLVDRLAAGEPVDTPFISLYVSTLPDDTGREHGRGRSCP